MKNIKQNRLVKTVYAYIDFFYKAFPFFIVSMFIPSFYPLFISIPTKYKFELGNIDIFGLFRGNPELMKLNNPSLILEIVVIVLNVFIIVSVFVSLRKLTSFIKNVFEGNPFCEENGKKLKFVGFVIVLIAVTFHITKAFVISSNAFENQSTTTIILILLMGILSVVFNPYLVLGLFVLVLGEIILHGVKMKEEIDLTV